MQHFPTRGNMGLSFGHGTEAKGRPRILGGPLFVRQIHITPHNLGPEKQAQATGGAAEQEGPLRRAARGHEAASTSPGIPNSHGTRTLRNPESCSKPPQSLFGQDPEAFICKEAPELFEAKLVGYKPCNGTCWDRSERSQSHGWGLGRSPPPVENLSRSLT